jgi:hypothetical protein
MMKLTNIGILNIQTTSQKILEQCEEISNVGFMVGTNKTFEQIQPCQISNVGMTIKVPAELPLVFKEESLILDDDFLSGLQVKTVFIVNGDCIIRSENLALIQEKIHEIVVNGNTYCPSSLKGLLSTLGRFNGRLIAYENGATFFESSLKMNETLLFRLPKHISTSNLRALDPALSKDAESLSSIEVLDSCWIDKQLFARWKDKLHLDFGAELKLLESPVRYYESDEILKAIDFTSIEEKTIAVDGTLTILGREIENPEQLPSICCKTLRAREALLPILKPLLLPGTKVETLESNKRSNHGKLTLSASHFTQLENQMRIKNHASLIFDESVTPEHVAKGIAQIENYGVIKAPEALMAIITDKTIKNFGKIKHFENFEVAASKEYAYENFGYLAL